MEELKSLRATLIFFEAPSRLAKTLADMAEIFGEREAAVMRELTKLHEEARRGTLPELAAAYDCAPPKGEITLVVGSAPKPGEDFASENLKIDHLLTQALDYMPASAAAALVAEATGVRKRAVYRRALELKEKNGKSE